MMLATTEVEDFDQFERIFSTKGAEKRREHGSKGAQVFRDPNQENRVWVCSTGTRRDGRASCLIRRCRRSCRRLGIRGGRRRQFSAEATTHSGCVSETRGALSPATCGSDPVKP
jgi:hypothetical protein